MLSRQPRIISNNHFAFIANGQQWQHKNCRRFTSQPPLSLHIRNIFMHICMYLYKCLSLHSERQRPTYIFQLQQAHLRQTTDDLHKRVGGKREAIAAPVTVQLLVAIIFHVFIFFAHLFSHSYVHKYRSVFANTHQNTFI